MRKVALYFLQINLLYLVNQKRQFYIAKVAFLIETTCDYRYFIHKPSIVYLFLRKIIGYIDKA